MKDHIYTREWFLSHYSLRDEYRAVADVIHAEFKPRTVIDVGCGLGLIIERLQELGANVWGLDGAYQAVASAAPESVRGVISFVDLSQPLAIEVFAEDLVICTEVAEHIDPQYAETLIDHVVARVRAAGHVFFTAATPGQGGTDHVNEQPNEYWISRFQARGMVLNEEKTMRMRYQLRDKCPGMNWMGRSAMVFQ